MRLDIKALAIAGGLLWGGAILTVGLGQMAWPSYGGGFLELMASVYPGYHGPDGLGAVLIGTLYGAGDGALAGLITAWLYNLFAAGGEGAA